MPAKREYSNHGNEASTEVLTADRTTTHADHGRTFVANAVDLTLTLHDPTEDGFWVRLVVATLSASTGAAVTNTTGINGGNTYTNTAATDALGDSIVLRWVGAAWVATVEQGTWAET